jgi:heme-degrading monooxygenase HmoA
LFVALWEYEVKPGNEEKFERVYGAEGAWARLFGRDPAYRGTRLLRDGARPGVYVTMDFWAAREDYERFRREHREEYLEIDKLGEEMTVQERCAGHFEEIPRE